MVAFNATLEERLSTDRSDDRDCLMDDARSFGKMGFELSSESLELSSEQPTKHSIAGSSDSDKRNMS